MILNYRIQNKPVVDDRSCRPAIFVTAATANTTAASAAATTTTTNTTNTTNNTTNNTTTATIITTLWRHCNLFENRVPVDKIYGYPIFKWVAMT